MTSQSILASKGPRAVFTDKWLGPRIFRLHTHSQLAHLLQEYIYIYYALQIIRSESYGIVHASIIKLKSANIHQRYRI